MIYHAKKSPMKGDNMHEKSDPIFWGEQNGKYYQLLSAEFALSVLNVAYHNCVTVLDPKMSGVVGCDKGVMYLASEVRPVDIGLQLAKACYPCSR